MREIRYTTHFERDYKREKAGRHRKILDAALMEIVNLLVDDIQLALKNADHPLGGDWADHRDCHIRPDLILIYRKPDQKHLDLVRLGSHAELGSRFCDPAVQINNPCPPEHGINAAWKSRGSSPAISLFVMQLASETLPSGLSLRA